MFKIFNPPLKNMTERTVRQQFPGKAYLFSSFEEIIKERDGCKIHSGIIGTLHCISDENAEDMDKFYKELKSLSDRGMVTSISTDFEQVDTIIL